MKKKSEYWWKELWWLYLLIILFMLIFILYLKNSEVSSEINTDTLSEQQMTIEDCRQLGVEAHYKKEDCKLEGLREIYGIDYEPNLRDGSSCYYEISNDICLSDITAKVYLDSMDEVCSENFPDRDEVFVECLSKIK